MHLEDPRERDNDIEPASNCPGCGAEELKECSCPVADSEAQSDARAVEAYGFPAGLTEHSTGSKADQWIDSDADA